MPIRVACLLLLCLATTAPSTATYALGTSTPAPVPTNSPTPVVTVAPEPSATPEPSPTPAAESRTPIVVTALPTAVEADPAPTLAHSSTATPRPHVTRTASSTPVLAPNSTPTPVIIDVPTPSAAELQQDARLRWGKRVPESVRRWAFLIVPAARKYHVDPNLVAAVMTMESDGDPTAWSPADARGLLQVLHGPWDPKINVFTGVRMLAGYLSEFQSVKLALAAYNAGPNAVRAYDGVPPYHETRDYVIIVMYLYALYGNHPLSHRHQLQYRRSLDDLRHFKDQRHKVKALAKAADLNPNLTVACFHFSTTCGQTALPALFTNGDPFWPMSGTPDPLQHVGPVGANSQSNRQGPIRAVPTSVALQQRSH